MIYILLFPVLMDSTICFSPKSVNMEFETSILMDADKLMQPRTYVETVQNVWDAFQKKVMMRAADNVKPINLRKSLENIVNNKYVLRAVQKVWDTVTETLTQKNGNRDSEGPHNNKNVLRNKHFLRAAQDFWTNLQRTFTAKDNSLSDREMRGTSKGLGDLLDHRTLLRTAHNVINSLQNVVLSATDENADNTTATLNSRDKVFSNFIQALGVVLLNYDNDALKELTNILHREMRRYYRDGPFNSVLHNPKMKDYVMKTLKKWTDTEPAQLKAKIKHYLSDTINSDFAQAFNQFFDDNDLSHLERLQKRLRQNSVQADRMDLTDIVKKAIGFLILDRYNHLGETSKARFGKELLKVSDTITEMDVDMLNVFKKAVDHTFRRFMQELSANTSRSKLSLIPEEEQTAASRVKNYNLIAALQSKNVTQPEVTVDPKNNTETKTVSAMGLNEGAEKYVKSITVKPEKSKPLEFY